METIHKVKTIAAVIALSSAHLMHAQSAPGQSIVTTSFGVGLSSSSFNAMYDYGLTSNFSIGLAYSKDDYRSIYSSRALVHFFPRPNRKHILDPYAGARIGLTNKTVIPAFLYDPTPDVSREGRYFSAQAVIGVREYFCYNALGINAELALGAPYSISIGINYNFQNWKTAFQNVPTDYHRDLISPVRKNILKFNFSDAVINQNLELSYERFIGGRFSVQLAAGYTYSPREVDVTEFDPQTNKNNVTSVLFTTTGITLNPTVRYYVQNSRKPFPKGLYVSAGYRYQSNTIDAIDQHPIADSINYNNTGKVVRQAVEFSLGRQWLFFKDRFAVDTYVGARFVDLKQSVKYEDSRATDATFYHHFGAKTITGAYDSPLFMGIKCGYAF